MSKINKNYDSDELMFLIVSDSKFSNLLIRFPLEKLQFQPNEKQNPIKELIIARPFSCKVSSVTIPRSILTLIFSFLDKQAIGKAFTICKQWYCHLTQDSILRKFLDQYDENLSCHSKIIDNWQKMASDRLSDILEDEWNCEEEKRYQRKKRTNEIVDRQSLNGFTVIFGKNIKNNF